MTQESVEEKFKYDIAVFGACGHVGLPLSISFAHKGFSVVGVDINKASIEKVRRKEMPFIEEGAGEILTKVIDDSSFILTDDSSFSKDCEFIIIVPGTPIDKDQNTDLSHVVSVTDQIIPYLRKEQCIILRSTLAPRTTQYLQQHIEKNTSFTIGKDIFLVYAPERIMEGKAIEEISSLPQIIGSDDDASFAKASSLFKGLAPDVLRLTYIEAELAKLFTNAYRYVNFALANEYFIIAKHFDANVYSIIEAINYNYPRANVPKVGFAKGPCLGKDAWLLLNGVANMSTFNGLISSAYRINEGLPAIVIDEIRALTELSGKKIVVLGLTFKRDCDDTRDSLSMKLVHLLKNEFLDVHTHDPYVDDKDIKEVLHGAAIVIIATHHSFYEKENVVSLLEKGTIVADIWNLTKKNKHVYVI